MLKPIKFLPPLKLELFPLKTLLSPLDPPEWTPLKFLSSTLYLSPPKFKNLKLKSPKNTKFVLLEKKSETPKLLYYKKWTSNLSLIKWMFMPLMITEPSYPKMLLLYPNPILLLNSKPESETSLPFLLKLDTKPMPPSPTLLLMLSKT